MNHSNARDHETFKEDGPENNLFLRQSLSVSSSTPGPGGLLPLPPECQEDHFLKKI